MPQYLLNSQFNIDTTPQGLVQEIGALKVAILAMALSGDQAQALRFADALKDAKDSKLAELAELIENAISMAQ